MSGRRKPPIEPKKRDGFWRSHEPRRETTSERGYGGRWQEASRLYRATHPVCVPCLLQGRVRASQCTDHIVPARSCPELFWNAENWAAMCLRCHGIKTQREPRIRWLPDTQRIVVCGLPGTGKTTFAKQSGLPYWDADEHPELRTFEAIRSARRAWIDEQRGPMIVIVASPTTASQLAAMVRGVVKHLSIVHRAAPASGTGGG